MTVEAQRSAAQYPASPAARAWEAPEQVVTEAGGIAVSGLLLRAREPRAVLVALHGGATTAAYFDCPGHPELSLVRVAAGLGFTVLALDRPGYGASAPFTERLWDPQRRVDVMYSAVSQLVPDADRGAGTFVIAHSAGCELALRMAADPRGAALLGIELAGTGREFAAAARQIVMGPRGPVERPRGLGDLLWRPASLYPPDLLGGAALAAVGPRLEAAAVTDWADTEFPALAARVHIPVRFTLGDHERVWRNDSDAMTHVGATFTAASRVVLNRQPGSGHNLSVGRSARAYHLGVLGFAEECLLTAGDGFDCHPRQFDGAEPVSAREVR
ncbi:pimeloyl-ACP methyl ester carboxylesterase [Nocardia kruczakiae]|uniref:Pimeloyl-ACP methyl ester carboxylesterase n=1 Tax=Nocardia kruczakiae TaxID=261477 RepID=A0ABU1X7F4_9NOCA|nr:alpha/beta fold hydrolase [Nocardia kruczakiae]MDR7166468.1 pimeloyl-ACP methyl ester carboxylesterase [Nocardia kruczakiae]